MISAEGWWAGEGLERGGEGSRGVRGDLREAENTSRSVKSQWSLQKTELDMETRVCSPTTNRDVLCLQCRKRRPTACMPWIFYLCSNMAAVWKPLSVFQIPCFNNLLCEFSLLSPSLPPFLRLPRFLFASRRQFDGNLVYHSDGGDGAVNRLVTLWFTTRGRTGKNVPTCLCVNK